jgi:hemin uptake protein HemP
MRAFARETTMSRNEHVPLRPVTPAGGPSEAALPDGPHNPEARPCDRTGEPCAVCRGLTPVRVVRSEELLGDQREVFIVHQGEVYRLLRTRNDRLILQK